MLNLPSKLKSPLIRLHLNGYNFTPKFFPTLVTLLLLPSLIALGFWQLDRAKQKQALLASYQARAEATPLKLTDLKADLNQVKYYPLQITGHYDNQHQILLDNKIYDHQVGYQVITPFIPEQSKMVVLVNRGWIPSSGNRQQLPKILPVKGQQTVIGMISIPAEKPFLLAPQGENIQQWPQLIQAVDFAKLSKEINSPVYPFVLLLSPKANFGFQRDWNPVTISPYKNLAYAVQWFALATALLIIFIIVNTRRGSR